MTARTLAVAVVPLAVLSVPQAALAGALCKGIDASNQPRLRVPLFQYAGTGSPEMQVHFSRYRAIIGVKLETLVDEIVGPRRDASTPPSSAVELPDYFKAISLQVHAGVPQTDTLITEGDRRNYWEASHALQLLRGELWPGSPAFVISQIYIGDIEGGFRRPEVRVRFEIEPELVPTTNDSHSLVAYYALAMDARRLKCDPGVVHFLLTRAKSIAKDIEDRDGFLTGDLAKLHAVIEKELESIHPGVARR